MSVTVNSFPPFESMNSPRGWSLAIIALLHALFFWLFASGMGTRMNSEISDGFVVVAVPDIKTPVKPVERQFSEHDLAPPLRQIDMPRPDDPVVETDHRETIIEARATEPTSSGHGTGVAPIAAPVIQAPMIDTRMPLSEPDYPPSEIRAGHAGTVVLSIYVLETGRVGDVRIEQSSGFPKLDSAATREAKRWKLKPGSQDGRPTAMWKTLPITFQLKK